MSLITENKKNEVYLTLNSEQHVHHELADYFSFELPEAKFLKGNHDLDIGMVRFTCTRQLRVNCMADYFPILKSGVLKKDIDCHTNQTIGMEM